MMAKEYGQTPTQIMGISGLPRGQRFHLDFDIYAATSMFIEDRRDERMDQNDPRSARVGSRRDQKDLIQDQNSRSKYGDSMEQAGKNAPSPSGQMQKLDEVMEQRQAGDQDGR